MKDMCANVTYGDLIEIAERLEDRVKTRLNLIDVTDDALAAAYKEAVKSSLIVVAQELREIAS